MVKKFKNLEIFAGILVKHEIKPHSANKTTIPKKRCLPCVPWESQQKKNEKFWTKYSIDCCFNRINIPCTGIFPEYLLLVRQNPLHYTLQVCRCHQEPKDYQYIQQHTVHIFFQHSLEDSHMLPDHLVQENKYVRICGIKQMLCISIQGDQLKLDSGCILEVNSARIL